MLTSPERRLRLTLQVLAVLFAVAALGYFASPFAGPLRAFARELPFVSNSVVKVAFLSLLCTYAAWDLRGRLGLVVIVIAAHLVSLAAMLIGLLAGTASAVAGPGVPSARTVLLVATALDSVITLLLIVMYLSARAEARRHPPPVRPANALALSRGERWLVIAAKLMGVIFLAAGAGYMAGPFLSLTRNFFIELPFVTNSVVKVTTLGMVCFYVTRDVRRNMSLMGPVIGAHFISIISLALMLMLGDTTRAVQLGSTTTTVGTVMWGALGADAVIAAILLGFYQAAWVSRFTPRFLWPMEYRALVALSAVVLGGRDRLRVTNYDIARSLDGYMEGIRARRRWIYHAVLFAVELHPVLYFKPPFSELDEESRLAHLKKHFYRDVLAHMLPEGIRRAVQAMIRIAKQMCYVGYYNDPRCFESIGYRRFEDRPRFAQLKAEGRIPQQVEHPLQVTSAARFGRDQVIETDICVIGSGAAGAIAAYQLAERFPQHRVLVVERGQYVQPKEFIPDEVAMIGRLYADGVFQQTEDFSFTILQGSCVGGSTTVNNAVCFDPPTQVIDRWNDPHGSKAGLDAPALTGSLQAVRQLLKIAPQNDSASDPFLNPSGGLFLEGARTLSGRSWGLSTGVVDANIAGCLGCGYCNIGCRYHTKLSMLQTVLPEAQRRFGDRVRIISDCEVRRLRMVSGRPPRVVDARAEGPRGQRVTIRAERFVLAAGAIASSYLLMRSGIGRKLPVGKRMSFNMASPLTGDFGPRVVNAHEGLQISHYGRPSLERGFVLETWWNPPATQAVSMPGWFEDHFENMRRWTHLMGIGVLVGTTATGHLREALTGGPGVVFAPEATDLLKLGDGLVTAGEIMFNAGATRVMPNTWGYDVITDRGHLEDLRRMASDPSYITPGTGHPQGGNAISIDADRGVVDPQFRVHGMDNLYVCDASVFPSSVTVNPQLTVMGLAHYAAQRIS